MQLTCVGHALTSDTRTGRESGRASERERADARTSQRRSYHAVALPLRQPTGGVSKRDSWQERKQQILAKKVGEALLHHQSAPCVLRVLALSCLDSFSYSRDAAEP